MTRTLRTISSATCAGASGALSSATRRRLARSYSSSVCAAIASRNPGKPFGAAGGMPRISCTATASGGRRDGEGGLDTAVASSVAALGVERDQVRAVAAAVVDVDLVAEAVAH